MNEPSKNEALSAIFPEVQRELTSYLNRLVVRPAVAEELTQVAALRFLEAKSPPRDAPKARAWLFHVGTNLAIDHLRRHSTWREQIMTDTKNAASADLEFLERSHELRNTVEVSAMAREHLAMCLACTMRNLPPNHSASLLLVEVYDFSVKEAAHMLGSSYGQVKSWIQAARATLTAKYEQTCALVTKNGVCYQCVELNRYLNGHDSDPLDGTTRNIDARLAIVQELRNQPPNAWHRLMLHLIDDLF